MKPLLVRLIHPDVVGSAWRGVIADNIINAALGVLQDFESKLQPHELAEWAEIKPHVSLMVRRPNARAYDLHIYADALQALSEPA